MTVADPLRSWGRLRRFDDRAHPARILPPAYQDAGLGSPRQQTAEQDYGREGRDRPPTIHGCGPPRSSRMDRRARHDRAGVRRVARSRMNSCRLTWGMGLSG